MRIHGVVASIVILAAALAAGTAWAADCGDTSGSGGTDVPCSCGDTVTTPTSLDGTDPVLSTVCPGDGLLIGPFTGADLKINGTLRGSGQGCGIRAEIAGFFTVSTGRIIGFDRGFCGADLLGVVLTRLQILRNESGGVLITESGATIKRSVIRGNGGPGMVLNGHIDTFLNKVQDNAGPGLVVSTDLGEGPGGTIRRNVVNRNEGDGIVVDCEGCRFVRNAIRHSDGVGIRDVSEANGQGNNTYIANVCQGNALGDSDPPGLCR